MRSKRQTKFIVDVTHLNYGYYIMAFDAMATLITTTTPGQFTRPLITVTMMHVQTISIDGPRLSNSISSGTEFWKGLR